MMNQKAYYISTATGILEESTALLTRLQTTLDYIVTTLQEAEKNQDEEELKSTYTSTGQKYLPVFEGLFKDVFRLRSRIAPLTPYRKYRHSQQYLLESVDCLNKSIQMQKDAVKKMADGDIEGAKKELLDTRPLIGQGRKAMKRFSSSI